MTAKRKPSETERLRQRVAELEREVEMLRVLDRSQQAQLAAVRKRMRP